MTYLSLIPLRKPRQVFLSGEEQGGGFLEKKRGLIFLAAFAPSHLNLFRSYAVLFKRGCGNPPSAGAPGGGAAPGGGVPAHPVQR